MREDFITNGEQLSIRKEAVVVFAEVFLLYSPGESEASRTKP
jgi:hypothetical protein